MRVMGEGCVPAGMPTAGETPDVSFLFAPRMLVEICGCGGLRRKDIPRTTSFAWPPQVAAREADSARSPIRVRRIV